MLLVMPLTGAISCSVTLSFVPAFTLTVACHPLGVSSSFAISTASLKLPTRVPLASFPSRRMVLG